MAAFTADSAAPTFASKLLAVAKAFLVADPLRRTSALALAMPLVACSTPPVALHQLRSALLRHRTAHSPRPLWPARLQHLNRPVSGQPSRGRGASSNTTSSSPAFTCSLSLTSTCLTTPLTLGSNLHYIRSHVGVISCLISGRHDQLMNAEHKENSKNHASHRKIPRFLPGS